MVHIITMNAHSHNGAHLHRSSDEGKKQVVREARNALIRQLNTVYHLFVHLKAAQKDHGLFCSHFSGERQECPHATSVCFAHHIFPYFHKVARLFHGRCDVLSVAVGPIHRRVQALEIRQQSFSDGRKTNCQIFVLTQEAWNTGRIASKCLGYLEMYQNRRKLTDQRNQPENKIAGKIVS